MIGPIWKGDLVIKSIKETELSNRVAEVLIGKTEKRLAKSVFKLPDGIYVRCEAYGNVGKIPQGIRISVGFDRYDSYKRSMYLKYLPDFAEATVEFDSAKLLKKIAEVRAIAMERSSYEARESR